MPLDKQVFTAAYAGIAIRQNGQEVAFSVFELLKYLIDWPKFAETTAQSDAQLKQETDALMNAVKSGQAVTPIGGLLQWYTIANELKQKKWDDKTTPVVAYLFNMGGRRVILRSPSDRYAYDYGSFQNFSLEIEAPSTTMAAYRATQNPEPDAIKPKEYLGYRDICVNMLNANFDNLTMAQAMRNVLMGRAPASKAVLQQTNANAEKATADIQAAAGAFQQGKMGIDELAKTIANILRTTPDITDLQQTASAALTITMKQRLDEVSSTEYFNTLSVLTASWFIAEFSRNHVAFAVGKMLLDLIEIGATLSVDQMPITFRTSLCHPDMPLTGALNTVDPERTLCKLGGLHPMTHFGSFKEDFGNVPNKLDKDNLSWSHIKSGAIICEWLTRLLKQQKIDCRIVNQAEYQAIKKLPDSEARFQAEDYIFLKVRKAIMDFLMDPTHQRVLQSDMPTLTGTLEFTLTDVENKVHKIQLSREGEYQILTENMQSGAKTSLK